MFVQAYIYHPGVGGGIRILMVLKVGRKYVDLFYSPRLKVIRLRISEWHALALVGDQSLLLDSRVAWLERVQAKANLYARSNMRYSQTAVKSAMKLCGGHYVTPTELVEQPE
jgi:hypothetical protein